MRILNIKYSSFFPNFARRNANLNIMEILSLVPRKGIDSLRLKDSDELVIMENFGALPPGKLTLENHGLIVICTRGHAQFEYDGRLIQLSKNDLFLYMAHSIADKFLASSDFNCRQIWFSRSELWSINMYGQISLADLDYLHKEPMVHLNDNDVTLLDSYFSLLCRRMRDDSPILHHDIVRSLIGAMMLEMLSIMRREKENKKDVYTGDSTMRSHSIADRFIEMVEKSDGRKRKVEEFARELNITPKYLSVILKEALNRRPSDMIVFYTLKSIESRLRYTDMTMQEIANDLNFPNASFFGKYVKDHLGMTPMEYRELTQGKKR